MAAYRQPGRGPEPDDSSTRRERGGPSLFDRIPWRVVIPAGMQLAQELREAVRDYSKTRGPAGTAPPPPSHPGSEAGPHLYELNRRLDRLEAHHEELGRLIERLAAQAAEQNRTMQALATRVAVWLGLSVVALTLGFVAIILVVAT